MIELLVRLIQVTLCGVNLISKNLLKLAKTFSVNLLGLRYGFTFYTILQCTLLANQDTKNLIQFLLFLLHLIYLQSSHGDVLFVFLDVFILLLYGIYFKLRQVFDLLNVCNSPF